MSIVSNANLSVTPFWITCFSLLEVLGISLYLWRFKILRWYFWNFLLSFLSHSAHSELLNMKIHVFHQFWEIFNYLSNKVFPSFVSYFQILVGKNVQFSLFHVLYFLTPNWKLLLFYTSALYWGRISWVDCTLSLESMLLFSPFIFLLDEFYKCWSQDSNPSLCY